MSLTSPIKIDIPGVGSIESNDLYLKDEADKVIAELEESHKMEVEQLLLEIVELKKKLTAAQQAQPDVWAQTDGGVRWT